MSGTWRDQFPLRARGRHVVNRHGERFKLAGVNWYGASDAHHVVGGLSMRSLEGICESVAVMGFTVVRLPFSNEMLRVQQIPEGAIDYELNPGLRGLTPLEVFDRVVDELGVVGVAVVLNNHTTLGMWSGGAEANGLWFNEGCLVYTEMGWIRDWLAMAVRYRDQPHVVGYDLRNEVRPVTYMSSTPGPSWGLERSNDWQRAAGNCARALLSAGEGDGLIIVERIAWPQLGLSDMLEPRPPWEAWGIPRDRVVLALHAYAWSGPGWWSPKAFSNPVSRVLFHAVDYVGSRALYGEMGEQELVEQLDREWGFCLDQDICPVWLSEFGVDLQNEPESDWFQMVCRYLQRKDADFAYWPLNVGCKPASGSDESYGLLTNDWRPNWSDARLRSLRKLLPCAQRRGDETPTHTSCSSPVAAFQPLGCSLISGTLPRLPSSDAATPWPSDCFAEEHEGPMALALHPFCTPLPGPLVPWPDDPTPCLAGELPPARYIWPALYGRDADAGQDIKVMSGSLQDLKQACIQGGFGGFALHGDLAYMREAPAEALESRLQDGFPRTVLFLAQEVRLCAVWRLVEEEAGVEPELADAGSEEREGKAAEPADGKAPASAVVEVTSGARALRQVCCRACLRHGYGGFELLGRPGRARLLPRAEARERALREKPPPAVASGRGGAQDGKEEEEEDRPSPRFFPRAVRQVHVLEHCLVRISLEAFPVQDAFPGSNARVLRGANLTACRQLCLEHGYGGFVVHRGNAYFRTANGPTLRRHLVPAAHQDTTTYVLTATEFEAGAAADREALLTKLLPSLWPPAGRSAANDPN